MKKITNLLMITIALFVFNGCADKIDGTVDLNYASFEANTPTIIVEKDGTTSTDIYVYTTQMTGSDRTFNISVVEASTTVNTEAYTVPATVTVPANSNKGTLTVSVSDNNLSEDPVTLELQIDAYEDVFIGNTATLNILKHCTLDINDFVGTYSGTAGSGDPTEVVTSLDGSGNLQITGIAVGWMENYWGEVIITMATLPVDVDLATGNFEIALTPYMETTWNGSPQPGYSLYGSGNLNACSGTMYLYYDLVQAGTYAVGTWVNQSTFTEVIAIN